MITDLIYTIGSTLPTHGMPSGTIGGVVVAMLVWFAPVALTTVLTLIAAGLLFKPRSFSVPLLLCTLAICANIVGITLATSLNSIFKTETVSACAVLLIVEMIVVVFLMIKKSTRESP